MSAATTPASEPNSAPWHALPAAEVETRLRVDPGRGLDAEEAEARLNAYGPNCLPQGKKAAQLQTIPGAVPDLIDPPPGCRFHPRCRHAMPVCSEVKPQPTALTDDHWASCHFVAQGLEAGRAS